MAEPTAEDITGRIPAVPNQAPSISRIEKSAKCYDDCFKDPTRKESEDNPLGEHGDKSSI